MKLIVGNAQNVTGSINFNQSTKIGEGATATIYRVIYEDEPWAAKIFNKDRTPDIEKLKAMIRNPPLVKKYIKDVGEVYQLAWPRYILKNELSECVGFLMPFIDSVDTYPFEAYFDPILGAKHKLTTEAALSLRLEIAINICEVISNLHAVGHYFIDVKPQNIKVSRATSTVILMDCDGFSINNKDNPSLSRFPAELISTDYIAPEVTRNKLSPKDLAEGQDNYALAVLLFQLLNRGTHPFQGILNDSSIEVNTNDEKASIGLYPYGIVANPKISPRTQSLHNCFPLSTRNLFDKAFTTSMSSLRPSAVEWKQHFTEQLENKNLVRCSSYPNNVMHIHFRDMPCFGCALEKIGKQPNLVKTNTYKPKKLNTQSKGSTPSKSNYPNSVSPNINQKSKDLENFFIWAVIIITLIYILSLIFSTKTPSSGIAPESVSNTKTIETKEEVCNLSFRDNDSVGPASLCTWLANNTYPGCSDEIKAELFARGQYTQGPQCGQKNKEGLNFKIKQLINSVNVDSIKFSIVDSSQEENFLIVNTHIVREFKNSKPTKDNGLDLFKGLRISGISGIKWSAHEQADCDSKNLGVVQVCYSENKDGNFSCQTSPDVPAHKALCIDSLEK